MIYDITGDNFQFFIDQLNDDTTQGFVIDPELTDPDGKWILTDAEMLSGHSGGPVINKNGEVIGWCVKSVLGPNKSWVRPINDAKQMLMV